ncbi:Protein of unknown function [Polaromonas sp. YR568]|uniref:DUF1090 domain-containing protein n=1 Tax=Polaromonas sp. YR568 TaxID=1855301 RepID=UPI0008E89C3D|nr:DUF1090 domain-containing protein [Polaromonas sp. YR568]SFU60667.1 Protein of unknown function [Polaromonas sp. YR568]
MKITFATITLASLLALSSATAGAATPSAACEAKRASIETEITQAKANGHPEKVKGLERALKANKAGCTDASLAAARDADIRKAEHKVKALEKDLARAEKKGKADKIARQKAKLEAAKTELEAAKKPVS